MLRPIRYDSFGEWLFMATGGDMLDANVERAKVDGATGDIVATENQTIGPSNTYLVNPWGNVFRETRKAKNNTEIISLNTEVLGHLAPNDVRANYILIGALWTQLGEIPPKGRQIGSLNLANSTMETYDQNLEPDDQQNKNCFSCHQGESFVPGGLSHIYWDLMPLDLEQ